jgi:sec-independent protein translocase protein TatB
MIGGLSMTEVIIILALALLLLGPDQLPSLAKSLGKGLRELRKVTDDLKGQFESEIARIDLNEQQKIIAPVPPPPDASSKPDAEKPAPAELPPNPADDPAAARAAARRAAAESQLKLVALEGTVARTPEPEPAAAGEPKA